MVTPLRRLAIATSRTEECIRFYTDVLGLKKFYDDVMTNAPGVKSLLGPEGRFPQRLVSMQAGDSTTGMMGFLEYLNASFTVRPFEKKNGMAYPISVEFFVEDAEATARKVTEKGRPIIGGPLHRQSAHGTTIAVTFTDPNGVLVMAESHPVGQTGKTPIPSAIRKVVIPVGRGKAEPTARFYQEVLDMTVFSDETRHSSGEAALYGLTGKAKTRLITLHQSPWEDGMIGFLEYIEPELETRPFVKRENYPYEVVLVFIVDDMDKVLSRALSLGGQLMGRRTYEVPGRGMVDGAMLTDSNGVVIDLTRWLEPQSR